MIRYILLLVLSLVLMLPSTPSTSSSGYQSSELEKVIEKTTLEDGSTVETTSYYLDGKLTVASNLRYARVVKTRTGDQLLETYFDADEEPAKLSSGHSAILRIYEDGNETVTTYLGPDLEPIINTSRYCTRLRKFENKQVTEEWYLDTEGNPAEISSGYFGRINTWENGRNTVVTYVDAEGNPKNIPSGYAIMKRTFYEKSDGVPDAWAGRIREEFYFEEDLSPALLSLNQHGDRKEYDDKGQNIRITYLDADGQIKKTGCAVVERTFTETGSVESERYYDAEGNPAKGSSGHYGYRKSDGKTIYLDRNGRDYFDLSLFLHNEPLAVILIGAVILLLSSFLPDSAPGKCIAFVLLIAYSLFILYMTLWNRYGEPRAELTLFWSYRQFFTSSSFRLEILNNIWLFVTLGAILMNLMPGPKGIVLGILFSVIIETVQYFTGFGLAEFDDVISNGLGTLIGAAMVFRKGERANDRIHPAGE